MKRRKATTANYFGGGERRLEKPVGRRAAVLLRSNPTPIPSPLLIFTSSLEEKS